MKKYQNYLWRRSKMSDLNKKSFYREVVHHLEEIETLYDEHDFDEDDDNQDDDDFDAKDSLTRFINHVKDAKVIAEEEG